MREFSGSGEKVNFFQLNFLGSKIEGLNRRFPISAFAILMT